MSVGLAALILIVVAVNIWTRTKGENIHRNKQEDLINLDYTEKTKVDSFCLFREQHTEE